VVSPRDQTMLGIVFGMAVGVIIGVALASGLGWWLHTQAWRS